jgi:hypothetical protein
VHRSTMPPGYVQTISPVRWGHLLCINLMGLNWKFGWSIIPARPSLTTFLASTSVSGIGLIISLASHISTRSGSAAEPGLEGRSYPYLSADARRPMI